MTISLSITGERIGLLQREKKIVKNVDFTEYLCKNGRNLRQIIFEDKKVDIDEIRPHISKTADFG